MKTKAVFFSFFIIFTCYIKAQNLSESPLSAVFETSDTGLFWKQFEKIGTTKDNPFKEYIEKGSLGVQGFVPYRIINADSLLATVNARKTDYLNSKNVLKDINSKEKKIRASYSALKYWYPRAVYPPVYFVYGRFTSGGTVSNDGIIIGTETLKNLDGIPGLVSHELIHFQQHTEGEQTLLKQCLHEGGADFIGEFVSGESINSDYYRYGERNRDNLFKEFVAKLKESDYQDWLYGTSKKDDRPNDLGYWIGYKICEAYFNKQPDKHKAIDDIINIKDPFQFLKESGLLDSYINDFMKSNNQKSEDFYKLFSDESYKVTFIVKALNKEDEIYITGNQPELGNWEPSKVKMNRKSALEREITLTLRYPVQLKFTKGNWDSEGAVLGTEKGNNIKIPTLKPNQKIKFQITEWRK